MRALREHHAGASLYDAIAPCQTVMIAGLAKNTGKTVTLNALVEEASVRSDVLGITSIGRDGERFDAINNRLEKPLIRLQPGTLVANSLALLNKGSTAFSVLQTTPLRTALGQIVIARITAPGYVEIAGPNSAAEIRQVSNAMLDFGADRILIDGAINRKAAASPFITDGVILATGAVLNRSIDAVVRETRERVNNLCLEPWDDPHSKNRAVTDMGNCAITAKRETIQIPHIDGLENGRSMFSQLLGQYPDIRSFVFKGALCESTLLQLASIRTRHPLTCVVSHGGNLFLDQHSSAWFKSKGIHLKSLYRINLKAITLNPTHPGYCPFNSLTFESLLTSAIPKVPIFDVLR